MHCFSIVMYGALVSFAVLRHQKLSSYYYYYFFFKFIIFIFIAASTKSVGINIIIIINKLPKTFHPFLPIDSCLSYDGCLEGKLSELFCVVLYTNYMCTPMSSSCR